jgi:GGDEF domain-containing protein
MTSMAIWRNSHGLAGGRHASTLSRSIDSAARQGRGEFALVLPETEGKDAEEVALRHCEHASRKTEAPQISIGAATVANPEGGQSIKALLSVVDEALYKMRRH